MLNGRYLQPLGRRQVPPDVYRQARARYGAGLYSPDYDDELDDELDDLPEEDYSLDVLDDETDDLEQLTRAELVEKARLLGIVPGRSTKAELIEAIREYAD